MIDRSLTARWWRIGDQPSISLVLVQSWRKMKSSLRSGKNFQGSFSVMLLVMGQINVVISDLRVFMDISSPHLKVLSITHFPRTVFNCRFHVNCYKGPRWTGDLSYSKNTSLAWERGGKCLTSKTFTVLTQMTVSRVKLTFIVRIKEVWVSMGWLVSYLVI